MRPTPFVVCVLYAVAIGATYASMNNPPWWLAALFLLSIPVMLIGLRDRDRRRRRTGGHVD